MTTSHEQIFLAIAVKNGLMSKDLASKCLQACRNGGGEIQKVVMERGGLTPEQVRLLEAGTDRVKMGESGTFRVQTAPAPAPVTAAVVPVDPKEPIPGYSIVGKLGSGGTSTVFLAEDRKNAGRNVALKILKPAVAREEKTLKNFLREAELLKKFAHPNLVKGYDYGTSGPLTYLVLEYLEGESVLDIIEREKQLPEARALGILVEAAKALTYITGNGIIHRDIKPDNLMATKDNRLVLCDLGFAIPMNRDSNGATDDEETTSGTVQYMSPEQARGQRDLDVRTDIYALGATLYHMIVGKVPFQGEDSMEIMSKQVMESLNSSEIKNRRISRHTHYFIERMMSKDKDLRYASPDELVKDVTEQMEGFQSLEYRAPEEKRNSKVLGGLAGKKAKITSRPRVKMKPRSSRGKKKRR